VLFPAAATNAAAYSHVQEVEKLAATMKREIN
jgi:hypothetical protein